MGKNSKSLAYLNEKEIVKRNLYEFMRLTADGKPSPPGDKTIHQKWSDSRSLANALMNKTIHVDSKEELEAVVYLKTSYGFTGEIVLGPSMEDDAAMKKAAKRARLGKDEA
ncbi:hypothetical protein ABFS83_04G032700 [Erythranthe nasuta]